MEDVIIKLLSTLILVISGVSVLTQIARVLRSDYKSRNTVEFKRKGSPDSVTISTKGTKQDARKLVDYLDRTGPAVHA